MRNKNIILGIGISMIIFPSLGLPSFWKNFLVAILGVWICVLFILERKKIYFGNLNKNTYSQKVDSIEIRPENSEDLTLSEDFTKSDDKTSQI